MESPAPAPETLSPEHLEWLRHSEALWRQAHRLASLHPKHDVSDLYHALRNLERAPAERLRLGLSRARLRIRRG